MYHRAHTETLLVRAVSDEFPSPSLSELVRARQVLAHQVLSLVRVEWRIQEGYQAEAASFIEVEMEKTKWNKTKILGSRH